MISVGFQRVSEKTSVSDLWQTDLLATHRTLESEIEGSTSSPVKPHLKSVFNPRQSVF